MSTIVGMMVLKMVSGSYSEIVEYLEFNSVQ